MPKAASPRPRRRPGRPPLAQDQRADRQARYLTAAAKVFAARGYRETDVQEIAAAAGVGKATLYRHFPTKLALFNATLEHGISAMQVAIQTEMGKVSQPFDQLRAGTRAYLTYWNRHPELVELLIQQRAEFRGSEAERCLRHREQGKVEVCGLFRRLIEMGLMNDVPPEPWADMLFDLLYGTMFFNRLLGRTTPIAHQADDLLDLFFHGSLTPKGRRQLIKPLPVSTRTSRQDHV